MSDDDHKPPHASDEATAAGLEELLAGPSPVNVVHAAIELGGENAERQPSRRCIDAGRRDIIEALFGASL